VTKRHILTYIILAMLCGTAYPFGREILIAQSPSGFIVISTFTLNYLLLFVLAGVVSPWLSTKVPILQRFKKSTASGIVMITLICSLLIALTLFGMQMRWS